MEQVRVYQSVWEKLSMNLTSKRVCYTHSVYGGHLKIFATLTEAQEHEFLSLNDFADNGGE
jgi:hypothetical protein